MVLPRRWAPRPGRGARRAATGAATLLALAATPACSVTQLQFHTDHRLHFLSPHARAKVTAPVTISWRVDGFAATGLTGSTDRRAGVFAVFLDTSPMPVGKTLKWVGHGDRSCARDPRCPDQQYLTDHNVYVTSSPSLTLPVLPAPSSGRGDEQHAVTIVLLDGTGRRFSEASWYLPFRSPRRSL